MLTDPLLLQWVPAWVVEQYERANPFFREALTVVLGQGVNSNKALLRRAQARHAREDYDGALSDLEAALEKEPKNGGARSLMTTRVFSPPALMMTTRAVPPVVMTTRVLNVAMPARPDHAHHPCTASCFTARRRFRRGVGSSRC